MNIVFMGTPQFAVPSLKALIQRPGTKVVGVFTQPDRPKGRGNKLSASPVKETAMMAGIPVFQPEKIRLSGKEDLLRLAPDLCVTAAFGQILNREILDIPRFGNINIHASLLPKHRGAAPVAYAVMNADHKTGVTTLMMDEGIDTGDILLQRETEIGNRETCMELTERLSFIGAELLMDTIDALESGTLVRVPQNHSEMTYDPMLKKEMGFAGFSSESILVRGRINGLNPWPCVSVTIDGERIKLLRADISDADGIPGTVLAADPHNGLLIACGEGAVRILELQAPGGKKMKTEDYLRGHKINPGTVITDQ